MNENNNEDHKTYNDNREFKTSKSKYVDDMTTFLSWQNYCLTQYSWTMFQIANYQNMINFQRAQHFNHLLSTQNQQTSINNQQGSVNNNHSNYNMNINQQGNAGLRAQERKGLNYMVILILELTSKLMKLSLQVKMIDCV